MPLKQYLEEHGISQQWIAEQLDISYQALYIKLKGKGNFSIKQAFKLKKVLKLTDEEFESIFG